MLFRDLPKEVQVCIDAWASDGFLKLSHAFDAARILSLEGDFDTVLRKLLIAFNGSDIVTKKIEEAANGGSLEARGLRQFMHDHKLINNHYTSITSEEFRRTRQLLLENPIEFVTHHLGQNRYPHYVPGRTLGFNSDWVNEQLGNAKSRLKDFSDTKRSETAVLIGNGPSLRKVDFSLFEGQDVFISNYAIKNPELNKYAKGIAVTNYLVAEQEPYFFQMGPHWRFFPLWLSNTFSPDNQTVFLNAVGGDLNFSANVEKCIHWHSTVSFFWLQILYHAGYKKILMTGFDNSYHQAPNAKEGDLIRQKEDDDNHFDKSYFKGKTWQAADTSKMEDTYVLSKKFYESDGREIVNCTVGGKLEIFRRANLADELPKRKLYCVRPESIGQNKVAVVTSFWSGDATSAELHWRLLNRLGYRNTDHIHLYKNSRDTLPLSTLPRVVCADIEMNYPEASKKPHPAGPNLVFAHTVRMLRDTGYTHFFWMEPDCVPTDKSWLDPFIERLANYPDEPIHGTGGGTVSPGKPFWKNHFAGCSLYSIEKLSEVDWDSYIDSQLDISFDVWLSVHLGYIALGDVNNCDQIDTIIFGKDRYDWSLKRKPASLVYGMFEHWRPEKFLSPEQLEDRLDWSGFKLYHAIKNPELLKKIYKKQKPSVSTIIINYNNDKYLRECIESALNQDVENIDYEVIVVDDGSTDSSQEIILEFGNSINAILLEHGHLNGNFNQQRGLRTGFEASSGDIILFLDGDDTFAPDKVKNTCRMFENIEPVIGQHVLQLIDENSQKMKGVCQNFPNHNISPDTYAVNSRVNFYQPTSGLGFRRCYLEAQKWLMRPDAHESTWVDVRSSRFAPYFGSTYNSRVILGAWRRHAASDSIRTDNIAERIRKHEEWFDQTSIKLGVTPVAFKWKFDVESDSSWAEIYHSQETLTYVLLSFAAQLLLSPKEALQRFQTEVQLQAALSHAVEADISVASHFKKCLEYAREKTRTLQ